MAKRTVRLLVAQPKGETSVNGVLITLIVLLPLLAPIGTASAQLQVNAEDFGILTELDKVISQRSEMVGDDALSQAADIALSEVRLQERITDSQDPIARVSESFSNLNMVDTTPPTPIHPTPYEMVLNPDEHPDEWANNIWGTLLTADNFVIWTHFKTDTGEEYDHYEEVDFSETALFAGGLIGLLTGTNPLLHEVSIDNDNTDEIEVGLSIDTSQSDGWGVEGNPPTTLWVEPTIEFSVRALDPSATVWDHIEYLEVSLMKQFAYSLNPLGTGESYVWVIDSRFTMMPEDFSLEVGLERFWFDIAGATTSFLLALTGIITGNVDESGISISSVAAPYAIHVDNIGQTDCPDDYDAATMHGAPTAEHRCTVAVGFGYIHFDAPADVSDKQVQEFAYIDLGIHPMETYVVLPSVIDLVLRNDDVLTTSFGVTGEGGLNTVEYFADERADLHLHFHENRSNQVAGADQPYGNITDSLGWLRGMPSGRLPDEEVRRVFRLVGSESSPELPGQMPERLSMILAIKNFSRDQTPNADDDTLPINPTDPPNTLVVLFATQSVSEVTYTSWFQREGAAGDHRRLRIEATDLPTGMVLQGSFQLGSGEPAERAIDNAQSDPLSALLDATILNLVDVFIDVGNIVNSIPEAIVDIVGGDGAGGGTGGELMLDFYTSVAAERELMALGMAHIELGSTIHPTTDGPHIIMAEPRGFDLVDGRRGEVEPLVPVSVSVEHSGLKSLHVIDDDSADTQLLSLRTLGGDPLRFIYLDHEEGELSTDSFQSIAISNQPAALDLTFSNSNVSWQGDRGIDEVLYSGVTGSQRQVVLLEDFPLSFTMELGGRVSWSGETPIGGISIQMGNATDLRAIDGDHFLFWQNLTAGEASLSAHISNVSSVSYAEPLIAGAEGRDGMPTAQMLSGGEERLAVVLRDESVWEERTSGINGEILIDPFPNSLEVAIPQSDEENGLSLPNMSTENGLAGIGFFLAGFSDVGRGVNDIVSGFATSLTGDGTGGGDFSVGIDLLTDTSFTVISDIRQGTMQLDQPEWVHGVAMRAGESENTTAFHLRTYLPDLPPETHIFVEYTNMTVRDRYHVEVELDGWVPTREEFIFDIKGYEGQDFGLTMLGLPVGESVNLDVEMDLERISDMLIPEIMLTGRYVMSHRLDTVHATLLDREGATRSEVLLNDIPRVVDLNAALGQRVHLSMTVPESEQTDGMSVDSLMMQQQYFTEGEWWPLTVFIREIPGEMTLDVEPSFNFDITHETSFQGIPTLDYASSKRGMDLFITAAGRAINSKGDMLLLAEDMASHAAIAPTADFGLSVTSSSGGLGRLYVKQTDLPSTPGVYVKQVEAVGENLQSATVDVYWLGDTYPIVKVGDVRGGSIAATGRVQLELGGQTFDARAVLIDAQTTSIIPSATTLGVNGLTSDLTLMNAVPGFDSSSTHWLFPEPLTTGAATLLFTIF